MLEAELFALLEQTADAAYTVTERGEICSWNGGAERLFGYPAAEVAGRNIDEVLDGRDALDTHALAGGSEAATRHWDGTSALIPDFDLEVRTRSGDRIWVNVSTIIADIPPIGRRLFVRLARDVGQGRLNATLLNRMLDAARQLVALANDPSHHAPVEPLSEQERRILIRLAAGDNPASIARKLKISAQTLRNHLYHINRKLRTHNRLQAVTHAQRRGLIP
jgi:PAS domain S-box-containing protein